MPTSIWFKYLVQIINFYLKEIDQLKLNDVFFKLVKFQMSSFIIEMHEKYFIVIREIREVELCTAFVNSSIYLLPVISYDYL